MFPYRELFLAVIISLASITLADVLVQPGYQHQSDSNSRYSQPVPQYQINSLSEQYRTEQLPNQELSWYLPRVQNVQTVYPYESNQDIARSNLVSYPHRSLNSHRHYHYSPRPNRPHYTKIGGHGYTRPSVFVGYPQPLIVHHRYKRSLESDPTTTESSKSAIVAHDNDVAAKSSLTDVKHLTANDSLLPEHEPTDTNDKRVENRQTKNDHVMMPRLFDLYPENIYSGRYPEYRPENAKIMQQPLPFNPSTPSFKSEAIETIVPMTKREYCCNNDEEDPRIYTNRPYSWEQPLEEESPDTDDDFDDDNNDEDPRLLTNRPSVKSESYRILQSLDTDNDYNTDKYRAASYRQEDSGIFYTTLSHNAMRGLPNYYNYNYNFVPMRKDQKQVLHQKLEKNLQEIINTGTINTAKRKQLDHMTIYIPRNVQSSINLEQPSSIETTRTTNLPCPIIKSTCNQQTKNLKQPSSTEAPITTVRDGHVYPVRGGDCGNSINLNRPNSTAWIINTACKAAGTAISGKTKPIETQYRNNKKLSGINENVDTPYSDRTDISLPFYFPHYPGNYPTYDYSKAISDWGEFSDNAEFYNRNSNSAYRSNPSKIRIIPNYNDKYYTNINDPNNLAPKIPQTQSQSLDTYNYSPENIQAVSSDLKYDDNTYPSDTQHYDMFSSPVYY